MYCLKIKISVFSLIISTLLLTFVVPAFVPQAFSYDPNVIENLSSPMGNQDVDVPTVLGSFTQTILSVVGSIALVIFIYGGIMWMTARGNAEQSKSAAQIMLWAALGVGMIFGGYLILKLVMSAIK